MRLELLVFCLALSGALAVHSGFGGHNTGGWGGGMTISRRDDSAAQAADDAGDGDDGAANSAQGTELYSLVDSMLQAATNGITVDGLAQASVMIQTVADGIVDSKGGLVDREEVQAAINEAAGKFSGSVALSSLFDEPLVYEAIKMDAALCLLNNLVDKANAQEAKGESSVATVAAISMTVQAIRDICTDTVGIVVYKATQAQAEDKNVNKRWDVSANYNRDHFGRSSYGVSLSHSWNGRRKRSTVAKRGKWTGGVDVNRGYGGGYSVGASVSYSWRR